MRSPECHTIAIGLTGDPVPVGSRSGAIMHRNDQRPDLRAHLPELRELQIVQQVQAQRVDGQDMHREVDACHFAGGGVIVAIAAQGGDPALGQ